MLAAGVCALFTIGCGDAKKKSASGKKRVVTSFTIIADMAREVAGDAAILVDPYDPVSIADGIHAVVAPIGFNKDISMALLPAMAAREVAVAAIGTVYSLDSTSDQGAQTLQQRLTGRWSLATALAFLAWFVFAPQCISTIAVTRRETNGWRWPLFMVSYLFVLAYVAAGATYWTAVAFGLG